MSTMPNIDHHAHQIFETLMMPSIAYISQPTFSCSAFQSYAFSGHRCSSVQASASRIV
jgi:hypothetical protein